ncbi:MAG: FG-GAP-like repeat-containing protein, partial [Acidobacteriota bacterium]
VAVGDFNGDGKLDLAVANELSAIVSILLGTGTGSFGAKTDFGTGGLPRSVAVRDFNGDGKLDLAVANSGDNTVSILLGTGTGSFGAKTDFGTGQSPFSVAVGDFNGDGKLDLATANGNGASVSILLGTGTGSFGAKTDFGTDTFPFFPFSVAVGDFNGDGKLDLAVANLNGDTVSIRLGTGTGSFGTKTDFATGSRPASVAVGDLNGDGKLDLAVANDSDSTVSILLNACTATTPCTAIVCAANITTTASINSTCAVATFAPVAGDTCPGVTPVCSPPSGSCFAVGTTTVTCTATDESGNTATCSFTVTVFNVCLQDDSNPGIVFLGDTITGAYRFCCQGTTFTGIAKVTKKGSIATFEQTGPDRKVLAKYDGGVSRGSASIQSQVASCTITDRDTRNNSCFCQ